MVAFYNPADQELYKTYQYLPQEQYRLGLNLPKAEQDVSAINTNVGIPATNAFINSGGGSSYPGSPDNLIQDYNLATRNYYFDRQPTPLVDDLYQSKLDKTFMGFPSYRQQDLTGADLGEYIGTDTDVPLELTRAGKIQQNIGNVKSGIGTMVDKIGGLGPVSFVLNKMDRFSSLPTADQKFIQMNMGYTGPTVFGENTSDLNKDPYGINTRSMFGNYAEYVDEAARSDLTDDEYNELTDYQKTKVDFYRRQKKERERIEKETFEQQMADDKFYGGQGKSDPGDRSRKGATGRRPGSGGTVDRVESGPGRNVDDTGQAYDSGGREGFGYGLKYGGLASIL
tara:strand:- start:590 stop:1609 length:1020 start_codon:yes stop_codon:yes gene_type:complete